MTTMVMTMMTKTSRVRSRDSSLRHHHHHHHHHRSNRCCCHRRRRSGVGTRRSRNDECHGQRLRTLDPSRRLCHHDESLCGEDEEIHLPRLSLIVVVVVAVVVVVLVVVVTSRASWERRLRRRRRRSHTHTTFDEVRGEECVTESRRTNVVSRVER